MRYDFSQAKQNSLKISESSIEVYAAMYAATEISTEEFMIGIAIGFRLFIFGFNLLILFSFFLFIYFQFYSTFQFWLLGFTGCSLYKGIRVYF